MIAKKKLFTTWLFISVKEIIGPLRRSVNERVLAQIPRSRPFRLNPWERLNLLSDINV